MGAPFGACVSADDAGWGWAGAVAVAAGGRARPGVDVTRGRALGAAAAFGRFSGVMLVSATTGDGAAGGLDTTEVVVVGGASTATDGGGGDEAGAVVFMDEARTPTMIA